MPNSGNVSPANESESPRHEGFPGYRFVPLTSPIVDPAEGHAGEEEAPEGPARPVEPGRLGPQAAGDAQAEPRHGDGESLLVGQELAHRLEIMPPAEVGEVILPGEAG